jgi:hypothetical protein
MLDPGENDIYIYIYIYIYIIEENGVGYGVLRKSAKTQSMKEMG